MSFSEKICQAACHCTVIDLIIAYHACFVIREYEKKGADKTNTHIEVLPPSVYALRGIIFYTVAKINQNLALLLFVKVILIISTFYMKNSGIYNKMLTFIGSVRMTIANSNLNITDFRFFEIAGITCNKY